VTAHTTDGARMRPLRHEKISDSLQSTITLVIIALLAAPSAAVRPEWLSEEN